MSQEQLKKGSTQALILAVLAEGPRHGYAIAREIEQRSQNSLKLGEGALYPALRAMERSGHVAGSWEIQESGPARRVYAITEAGQAELSRQTDAWRQFSRAVSLILGGNRDGEPV